MTNDELVDVLENIIARQSLGPEYEGSESRFPEIIKHENNITYVDFN